MVSMETTAPHHFEVFSDLHFASSKLFFHLTKLTYLPKNKASEAEPGVKTTYFLILK